jgi:hypothetical protein
MRRLGHHLYTSFGGQRTTHLSPWLADWREILEDRARECYPGVGQFDILHAHGLWLATFVMANGFDHVKRPRSLVHQIVLEDANVPAVFSPLILRQACLTRLDHEDPAIGHRLPQDLDPLMRSTLPKPQELARVLHGPARPLLAGFLHALQQPGTPVAVTMLSLGDVMADLSFGLCAVLMHGPECHLSSLAHPLPDDQPRAVLHLQPAASAGGATDSDEFGQVMFAGAEQLLDFIAGDPKPPRLLFFLRQCALARLLEAEPVDYLRTAFEVVAPTLDHDGIPQFKPDQARAELLLQALLRVEARGVLRAVLDRWAGDFGPGDEDIVAELGRQSAAPTDKGLAHLCRLLSDSGEFPSLGAMQ